jgi:signal transduction histidine kinase
VTSRSGSAKFRPRARIIQALGRDLISNEIIAIQELIKNSYDADATRVTITFEEPLLPGKGAVTIADNGDGMALDVIKSAWMEPATVSKLRKKQTKKGRRVTGEKGIGRFAAARIARVLEMTTFPRGRREEINVCFDWGAFENESRYLDQIKCKWSVKSVASSRSHGTILRMIGLCDEWDEDEKRDKDSFTNLRAELSRLVAPLTKDEFTIKLKLPDRFEQWAGLITPPEVLGKPHYYLRGSMDGKGELTASYQGPDGSGDLLENGNRPRISLRGKSGPKCGSFKFEFRVWDRQPEDLEPLAKEIGSTVRDIRRDLNAASGISVYRDNFRVLIPENDWLRLDLRRVQNPTLRVSSNQVVGKVFISADHNQGLRDQTNRQGIVDTPELDDFKACLIDILSRLEVKRDDHRRRARPSPSGTGIFEKLQLAPIRTFLVNRYPNDKELSGFLDRATQTFDEGLGEVQQVLARYRRLATLGQLIDVVLHEGRTPLSTIRNEIRLAVGDFDRPDERLRVRLTSRFQVITEQADLLGLLFKRLGPFSGRRRGRPVRLTLEQLIRNSFDLFEEKLRELKIAILLPSGETWVTVDPSEMQMIFVNLLDNSLYWLAQVAEHVREIVVQLQATNRVLQVIFSDSGLGIPEEVRERIFDPYFSTKPEGVGLGLTIAGETAAEYDGTLELLATGPLPGATFRVTLQKRLGIEDGEEQKTEE